MVEVIDEVVIFDGDKMVYGNCVRYCGVIIDVNMFVEYGFIGDNDMIVKFVIVCYVVIGYDEVIVVNCCDVIFFFCGLIDGYWFVKDIFIIDVNLGWIFCIVNILWFVFDYIKWVKDVVVFDCDMF